MMKRIAALTALAITLLAVPATAAMASTSGSGPGYVKPRPVQLVCPRVHRFHRGYVIMSVNPGANSFTVFRDGFLFVNKGAAITSGTALMCCAR